MRRDATQKRDATDLANAAAEIGEQFRGMPESNRNMVLKHAF